MAIIFTAKFVSSNAQEPQEKQFIFSFGKIKVTKNVFIDSGEGWVPQKASLKKIPAKRWKQFLSSPCLTVQDKATGDTFQVEFYRVVDTLQNNPQDSSRYFDVHGKCFPDELVKQIGSQDFFMIKWIEVKESENDRVILLKFEFAFFRKENRN